jgi:ATP-dependent Clp protease ATP-binding subunit ClpX
MTPAVPSTVSSIVFDEVDKLAKRSGRDRGVSGEGVQQGLLKIVEGKRVQVKIGGDRATGIGAEVVEVDTYSILFIAVRDSDVSSESRTPCPGRRTNAPDHRA